VCGERPQRRKAIMRVIPQREPGGELYLRPGTCALLSDSLPNICPTGQNLGGRITLASPTTNSGGTRPPRPPRSGVYAYDRMPGRVKPSFVTFDIRALWRSALSVRVPGCQQLQMMA